MESFILGTFNIAIIYSKKCPTMVYRNIHSISVYGACGFHNRSCDVTSHVVIKLVMYFVSGPDIQEML